MLIFAFCFVSKCITHVILLFISQFPPSIVSGFILCLRHELTENWQSPSGMWGCFYPGRWQRQTLCLPPPQTPGQPQSALCVQGPWLPSVGTSSPQTHLRPHCWLPTSTTSHSTPPRASTYFRFSLSSFPRGWRWPRSYKPDEQTSATAREKGAGLEDLTFMRVAVIVWSPGPTRGWGSQRACSVAQPCPTFQAGDL